jgi:hypothetical protein
MPTRKVHFYRIVDPVGTPLPDAFRARAAAQTLRGLDVAAGEAHFETADDVTLLGATIHDEATRPPCLALYQIRRTDLPSVERRGQILDLDLAADAGLAEGVHVCFFPRNVVGFLYNHFGPRISRLADYLNHKLDLDPQITFQPLIRSDVMRTLQQMRDLTILELEVPAPHIELFDEANQSLAGALRAAQDVAGLRRVGLRLKLERREAAGVTQRVREMLAGFIRDGRLDAFSRLKVLGYNTSSDQREWLDLLAERLVMEREVQARSEASRTISDTSADIAIRDAHREAEQEIIEILGRPQ